MDIPTQLFKTPYKYVTTPMQTFSDLAKSQELISVWGQSNSDTSHVCTTTSQVQETLQTGFGLFEDTQVKFHINHSDLFEGLLLAIGVEDIDAMRLVISAYAHAPIEKRMGQWRIHLIEDQIRYLETILKIRTPKEIDKKFMLNPQARKGVIRLQKLFDQMPFLMLDFSVVPSRKQTLIFEAQNQTRSLRGAQLISPECIGFDIKELRL